MKHIALALVGLSISTASFAEPQIKAFCFENVKPNQKLSGYHGLYVGQMPVGSKLLLNSTASAEHSYHLKAYVKDESAKNLRKLNVDKTSTDKFEIPGRLLGESAGGCFSSCHSSSHSEEAQGKNQTKMPKTTPVANPSVDAPYQWMDELPPLPESGAPTAPKQKQTAQKDQGPVYVAPPEQDEKGQPVAPIVVAPGVVVPAAPQEVTVRLSNHYKFGDMKHTKKVSLKMGESATLKFNYSPGAFQFNHGGVDMVCEVQYQGDTN